MPGKKKLRRGKPSRKEQPSDATALITLLQEILRELLPAKVKSATIRRALSDLHRLLRKPSRTDRFVRAQAILMNGSVKAMDTAIRGVMQTSAKTSKDVYKSWVNGLGESNTGIAQAVALTLDSKLAKAFNDYKEDLVQARKALRYA